MALFAGLMSGTSLDGVDAVLAWFAPGCTQVRAHVHLPFDDSLRSELLLLNRSGADELHRAALAANRVVRRYAEAAEALCRAAGTRREDVVAAGAHGQTVRHRPLEFDGTGYTLQLLNGALLAELSGLDVVCDLRSRDVAAGGQGAPLVPAFHAAAFARPDEAVAVLNIGGIANLTLLAPDAVQVSGFDCGPGNLLMDLWSEARTGARFDDGGRWAASGKVHAALLDRLLADPFFARAAPKSTGRDHFHRGWLDAALAAVPGPVAAHDVQATLAELTAATAAQALQRAAPQTRTLLVCGGGASNTHLMARLAARLAPVAVATTAAVGVSPQHVEALAFAWLAKAFVERRPGNLPAVTGAHGPRVLGALYPAG
jgi:anhydro-N-acetylmuramic acid kinase